MNKNKWILVKWIKTNESSWKQPKIWFLFIHFINIPYVTYFLYIFNFNWKNLKVADISTNESLTLKYWFIHDNLFPHIFFYSYYLQKVCILLSQYLSVCRHDFACFSCGREFHLPGTTITKPRTKINKERARSKPDLIIANNPLNSKEPPKLSLIPSRKTKSGIQKDPNPSKTIAPIDPPIDLPIEIEHVAHESADDNENLLANHNGGAETIATKTNLNNNESDLPATKIENIDRSVQIGNSAQWILKNVFWTSLTTTLTRPTQPIALQQSDGPSLMVTPKNRTQILNTLHIIFSAATSYFEELEIERYCDEDIPVINIPQTSATKKTNSANTSPPITSSANISSTLPDREKIKTISTSSSLKRPRKNGPKEYKRNTVKKFIGKKKKYKNMSETEILKDYYLNHCGLCRIKFKDLDENMKLGMVQNGLCDIFVRN